MPMYTYQCHECGAKTEALRKYDERDRDGPSCNECGETTERVGVEQPAPLKKFGKPHQLDYMK